MHPRFRETWASWFVLALIAGIGVAPVVWLVLQATLWFEPSDQVIPVLDGRTLGLLWRSLGIALAATALSVSAGAVIGLCLGRVRFVGRQFLGFCLFIVFCISPYVLALGWLGGNLTSAWSKAFIGNPWAVAWVLGSAYMPITALIIFFGARHLPSAPEHAGLLAVGFWRTLVSILLPSVIGVLGIASLFVFALTFADYSVASLLQVPTYPIEVFLNYAGMFRGDQAARSCLPLLLIGAILAAWLASLAPGIVLRNESPDFAKAWPVSRGTRALVFGAAWGTLLAAISPPLCFLLARFPGVQASLFALESGWDATVHSIFIAAMTVCGTLALAVPGSAGLASCRQRWLSPIVALLILPYCVPASAYGIAWVELVGRFMPSSTALPEYVNAFPSCLCLSIRFAGPTVLLLAGARRALPREAIQAAMLQESRATRRFIWIELPLMAPAILGCAAVLLALSLNAVDLLVLTVPPGFDVLPLRTDNLLHYGVPEEASILAFATAVLAAVPAAGLMGGSRLLWGRGH